jgi:hypothetical protein
VYRVNDVCLVGHGRSGTKWVLRMLDESKQTFCRNEPNEISDSPFASFPTGLVRGKADETLERNWDQAVAWSKMRQGDRDLDLPTNKVFVYRFWRIFPTISLARRHRVRMALAKVNPELAEAEWRLPWFVGSRDRLGRALPVFKMALEPGWAHWLLRKREETLVVHLVRHPGGFLHSWRNRYLAKHQSHQVLASNIERLKQVVTAEPAWRDAMGDPETMGLEESELWYWAYANHMIHQAGANSRNYRLVVYEGLAERELETAREIYSHAGLEWNEVVASRVAATCMMKPESLNAWRATATKQHIKMIGRILECSQLSSFWVDRLEG